MSQPSTIDFRIYIAYRTTPIAWAWLLQMSESRKNSITSFMAHAAESVLRFERLGLTFSPDQFELQTELFADASADPRLMSNKMNYNITVPESSFPLLFDYLRETDKDHWPRRFIPLLEVYLIAFWGQVTRQSKPRVYGGSTPAVPNTMASEGGASEAAKSSPAAASPAPAPDHTSISDDQAQAVQPDSPVDDSEDKDKKAREIFGNPKGSNLDQWS